jgi:hypothetical protein
MILSLNPSRAQISGGAQETQRFKLIGRALSFSIALSFVFLVLYAPPKKKTQPEPTKHL